jgi:hypothetical protein
MKKVLMSCLMLMSILTVQAQQKITPAMKKGQVKTYSVTSVTKIPGQKDINIKLDQTFTVKSVKKEGCVIDIAYSNSTSDATPEDVVGQLLSGTMNLLSDQNITVATDKDGKPVSIANYTELRKQLDAKSEELANMFMEKVPALSQVMSKEKLKETMMKSITEENILNSLQGSTSVLALNGKTVATGAAEEYVNDKGIKMRRLYFVNPSDITTNSAINMTQDELKTFIIAQVEQILPEQASMIKQNIDMVMKSGMMKIDMKETAVYKMANDNWVNSLTVESTYDMLGQKTITNTTIESK